MNPRHAVARTAARPAAPRADGLRGRRLLIARVAWFALVTLLLGLFAAAVPTGYDQLSHPPDAVRAGVERLGLGVGAYAAYVIVLEAIVVAGFLLVAAVIVWRELDHWMTLFVALTLVAFAVIVGSPLEGLAEAHPAWRPPVAGAVFLGYACMITFFYLFPDGRFVPAWTRWLALGWAALVLAWSFVPEAPFSPGAWPPPLTATVVAGTWGSGVAAQIYRYRRVAGPIERQQAKWLVFGGTIAILGALPFFMASWLFPEHAGSGSPYEAFVLPLAGLSYLFIPLSVGVAVLRYRLWDIDIIINRTLVYGALTASAVGLYLVVVGGLGALLQARGDLLISLLATGLIAVLFQPLHARLQRGVNRLMYGERDDPYVVLSRLGQRLEATLAPDAVLPAIVETVKEALKLPYAAIEVARDGGFGPAASAGAPVADPLRLPLVHQGETVGRLVLGPRAGEVAFAPTDRRLLDDLARQAGVAVRAARLRDDALRLAADLQRSRARLVTAREEERRRLRRDLHDGLGPELAGLTMKAEAARDLLPADPARAEALLTDIMRQTQTAVADIRRLVYGLRPPALDDLGLVGALRAYATQYAHGGVRVAIEAPLDLPPLPAAVEVAAYRIALEALTNVARHAHARHCLIRIALGEPADELCLEITDDGAGLPAGRRAGVGLASMRERAAELDGVCIVEARPEGGTRVCARLPCARGAAGDHPRREG